MKKNNNPLKSNTGWLADILALQQPSQSNFHIFQPRAGISTALPCVCVCHSKWWQKDFISTDTNTQSGWHWKSSENPLSLSLNFFSQSEKKIHPHENILPECPCLFALTLSVLFSSGNSLSLSPVVALWQRKNTRRKESGSDKHVSQICAKMLICCCCWCWCWCYCCWRRDPQICHGHGHTLTPALGSPISMAPWNDFSTGRRKTLSDGELLKVLLKKSAARLWPKCYLNWDESMGFYCAMLEKHPCCKNDSN